LSTRMGVPCLAIAFAVGAILGSHSPSERRRRGRFGRPCSKALEQEGARRPSDANAPMEQQIGQGWSDRRGIQPQRYRWLPRASLSG
jgi:hypothetical protein